MKPMEEWSVTRWFATILSLIVFLSIFFFVLNSAGLIGGKIVERKVLENSLQYSEARKTAVATYEAQLAETQAQLSRGDLTEAERAQLRAQAARIRVLLETERRKQ